MNNNRIHQKQKRHLVFVVFVHSKLSAESFAHVCLGGVEGYFLLTVVADRWFVLSVCLYTEFTSKPLRVVWNINPKNQSKQQDLR